MIIVDGNNIAMRMAFVSSRDLQVTNFAFFRHIFVQSIMAVINKFGDAKVIITKDHGSWRKIIYEPYKAHRADARQKMNFDFEGYFKFLDEFWPDFVASFPVGFIDIKYCEGDDTMGTIAMHANELFPGEDITIITMDRDLIQAKIYGDNIIVYDPIGREERMPGASKESVELYHKIKVMTGDPGDNVPPVEKGIGEKRAAKIFALEPSEFEEWMNVGDRRANWERNWKLMSFCQIPQAMQTKIISETNKASDHIKNRIQSRDYFKTMISFYNRHNLNKLKANADEHIEAFARWTRF